MLLAALCIAQLSLAIKEHCKINLYGKKFLKYISDKSSSWDEVKSLLPTNITSPWMKIFYTTGGHTSAILTYKSPFINDNLATLLKFFLGICFC